MKPNEWQEFRRDRETTLKTNPDLAAEYKDLMAQMEDQLEALNAAMIKADPKVAPVVAKLELIRKHISAPGGTPSAKNNLVLTPAEWKEIQTAHQAALKANPDFDAKAVQLAAKLRAFEGKVAAAMVKADPTIAPIVAKFEGGHPAPQVAVPPGKPE